MTVRVKYFAVLREQRGLDEETVTTSVAIACDLYSELKTQHGFSLDPRFVRTAINGMFVDKDYLLIDNDEVVFIPPVAGG